jgi:hypothetical protein
MPAQGFIECGVLSRLTETTTGLERTVTAELALPEYGFACLVPHEVCSVSWYNRDTFNLNSP